MNLAVISLFIMTVLTACGEDDGEGGSPDLFLGLSGFVIAVIVVWALWRWSRNRR